MDKNQKLHASTCKYTYYKTHMANDCNWRVDILTKLERCIYDKTSNRKTVWSEFILR